MTTRLDQAGERTIAATLVYEAKVKEHEAAAWLGLQANIDLARAAVHAAADSLMDRREVQIRLAQNQYRDRK